MEEEVQQKSRLFRRFYKSMRDRKIRKFACFNPQKPTVNMLIVAYLLYYCQTRAWQDNYKAAAVF